MPILIRVGESYQTEQYSFSTSPIVFGRLAKSDICIKHDQVSRRHAQIVVESGAFVVEDLESTNCVYVNHEQVRRIRLRHGDVLNVGGVADFIFLVHDDPALAQAALAKLKSSPEHSAAAYSMKKAVQELVSEVAAVAAGSPASGSASGPGSGSGSGSAPDPERGASVPAQSALPAAAAAAAAAAAPDEMARTRSAPGPATIPTPRRIPVNQGLADIQSLLHVTYTLNSTLSLKQLLETLLAKVLHITRADRGFILLKNARTREIEVRLAQDGNGPLPEARHEGFSLELARRCVSADRTIDSGQFASDPALAALQPVGEPRRAMMVSPLKVKSSVIGAIYVDRPALAFARKDLLFFEALCHQAAIAVDNSRLTEDLKDKQRKLKQAYDDVLDKNTRLQVANEKLDQKVAELAALNAVSRGLNMVSTLDQVLKLILEKTIELLGVEKGSLLLVNEETDMMELKVIIGVDARETVTRSTRLRVGDGIAGLALRQGVPIAVNDGHKNPQFKQLLPADAGIRNLLCVPLILNNRKVGVVNLTNKLTGAGFTENDKTLVATMASQAAITIENARLYNLAIFDGLTNLHVARYFHLYLEKELQRCRRYGGQVSLVMCDLDRFKSVNDTYGHQVGDLVLQKVAQVVRDAVRSIDVAARYGGEEFAVILPETDLEGANTFAERLRVKVESAPVPFRGRTLPVTVSVGVASFPAHPATSKAQLVAVADRALYDAKHGGRNRVVTAPVGVPLPLAPCGGGSPDASDADAGIAGEDAPAGSVENGSQQSGKSGTADPGECGDGGGAGGGGDGPGGSGGSGGSGTGQGAGGES
jgi:diguanylate cyclase (GGDEF)-like protein